MRCLRGVHADARIRGREQTFNHTHLIGCWVAGSVVETRLLLTVWGVVGGGVEALFESLGRSHGGAGTRYRVERCESKPCFIPQEDKIGLDRQALSHDALGVVHDAVEGAVGERHHAHLFEAPGSPIVEQHLFDA